MINIRYKDSTTDVTCDGCSSGEMTIEDCISIKTAAQSMRAEGWSMQQNGRGEWKHFCPDCVDAGKINRRRT